LTVQVSQQFFTVNKDKIKYAGKNKFSRQLVYLCTESVQQAALGN